MLSRATLRSSKRVLNCAQCAQRRGFAAPTSGQFPFEITEAAGTKLVSRNLTGPTSTLALVSKAGTRYQWLPGLSEALANFAFRNTDKRFTVRIVRETELLGSEFFSNHSREAVVYGAKFLREDLPYFVELLAEVASETKYQTHVFHEDVERVLASNQAAFVANPAAVALDAAHGLAFHRGLGYAVSQLSGIPHIQAAEVEAYASAAYSKPNFALVGSGIDQAELAKWTGEFFKSVPGAPAAGLPALESPATKYYGGESRIAHGKGNAIVFAFEGSSLPNGSAYKPEVEVLATLLGGASPVKWSSGNALLSKVAASHPGVQIKTDVAGYSDGGLLYITVTGSAKAVATAAQDVAKTIKSVAQGQVAAEDVKRAIAQAKFQAYESVSTVGSTLDLIGLNVIKNGQVPSAEVAINGITGSSEAKVKEAAKKILGGKVTVSTVGALQELPWAEDLGLNV